MIGWKIHGVGVNIPSSFIVLRLICAKVYTLMRAFKYAVLTFPNKGQHKTRFLCLWRLTFCSFVVNCVELHLVGKYDVPQGVNQLQKKENRAISEHQLLCHKRSEFTPRNNNLIWPCLVKAFSHQAQNRIHKQRFFLEIHFATFIFEKTAFCMCPV